MRSAWSLKSRKVLSLVAGVLALAIGGCSSPSGGDDEALTTQPESPTSVVDGGAVGPTAPAGLTDDGPASTTPTASTATTPTSAEVATGATPSLSTLPSTSGVAITSPASNDVVGSSVTIEGTAGGVPADRELWLVLRPLQGAQYVVPAGSTALSVAGGSWQATLDLGNEPEVVAGQQYIIFVVQVDRAGGQALRSAADLTALLAGAENVAAVIVELQA